MAGFQGKTVAATVLRAAQRGSRDAHAAIYRCYADAVYTVALRLVVDPGKAEDVLQETFIEVIRSIAAFRGDAALGTWIRHIAVSKSLMLLRSAWEHRASELPEPELVPATSGPESVPDRQLTSALAALDAASRAVVWLFDVEGYTHAEIAALTGKSVSFSKSRLARAHAALRRALASGDGTGQTSSAAAIQVT